MTSRSYCMAVAAGVALLVAGCKKTPSVATLSESTGSVTVRHADTTVEGSVAAPLYEEDIVATGVDGKAAVTFSPDNVIGLGPNTSVVIRKSGGELAEFGAVLMSGEVVARRRGGLALRLGTPFGLIELGADSEVRASTRDGLVVNFGAVELLDGSGNRKTLDANSLLQIDGLVVPLKKDTIVLPPMAFVLTANPAQVQIKRAGEEAWRAPAKREDVKTGDSIRTRKATGTRLQTGELGGVTLKPQAELLLEEPAAAAGAEPLPGELARYDLKQGGATIALSRNTTKAGVHQVQAGAARVAVEPGPQVADVDITSQDATHATVLVRLGKATLPDGMVVGPGTKVEIAEGRAVAAPIAFAQTHVVLRAPSSASVFYVDNVPPMNFSWKDDAPGPYPFEIAKDKKYEDVVIREELGPNSFLIDSLRPGKYYWRVKVGAEWRESVLTIDKARDNDCKNCKRTNTVEDTGESTVVYFQKTLPAITFRWSANDKAASYRLKVFAEGALDKPLVNDVVAAPTVAFPTGKFAENRYFWLASAVDAEGKDIATGKMNSLTIAYDNAVTDIDIRAPGLKSTANGSSVTTYGEVQLGSRLSINGKSISLDRKGRFRHTVSLSRGDNQIVYRTIASNGVERLYVRMVNRR